MQNPGSIVGSPMCAMLSALQKLDAVVRGKAAQMVLRTRSTCSLWASCTSSRSRRDRWFLHIHPASANLVEFEGDH